MPEKVREAESALAEQVAKPKRTPVVKSDMAQLVTKVAVIAVVAVVAVVAAYLITVRVLKPMMATDPNAVQEQMEAVHGGESGRSGRGEAAEEVLFEIEQIIVNPASTVGSRFLSCSMAFELKNPDDLGRFESREIKIRDALITILSARTVDELADARLREPLRRQILARINRLTEPAEAVAVYFKDFVLQ